MDDFVVTQLRLFFPSWTAVMLDTGHMHLSTSADCYLSAFGL